MQLCRMTDAHRTNNNYFRYKTLETALKLFFPDKKWKLRDYCKKISVLYTES